MNELELFFFTLLTKDLTENAKILDLGSGSGLPYDLHLVNKGFQIQGIDISEKHVEMARSNVPGAKYVLGDFLNHPTPNDHFDATIALYSLFHTPRESHARTVRGVASTLRSKGRLLITVGIEDVPYKTKTMFCGSAMAWSHFDARKSISIITNNGFTVLETADERDFGGTEKHLWVLAEKTT